MAKSLALFGRITLAMIFIASGMDKLQSFDLKSGGPVVAFMAPKLERFFDGLGDLTNIRISLQQEAYPYLILAAASLELVGGILFIADSTLGALLLMVFLLTVTPVMHNFWDADNQSQVGEMIHFMKNLSIFGGLVAYTAIRQERSKFKTD